MSAIGEAIAALREALKLADDVRRLNDVAKTQETQLREHDRRITRLEAKWETAIELAQVATGRRQLPGG